MIRRVVPAKVRQRVVAPIYRPGQFTSSTPTFATDMGVVGTLRDRVTGVSAVCSINGTRYGEDGEVYGVNVPPVDKKGRIRGCPAFTQLAKMTETLTDAAWNKNEITVTLQTTYQGTNIHKITESTSATAAHNINQGGMISVSDNSVIGICSLGKYNGRTIEAFGRLKDGSYVVICVFNLQTGDISSLRSGSVASCIPISDGYYRMFASLPVGTGVTDPRVYLQLRSGTTNSYTGDGVSGVYLGQPTYINFGVGGIPFIPPYVPNDTTSSVSVVSEAATASTGTSFNLNDPKLVKFKKGIQGPLAQGHIELEFESNVDSGWLPNSTTVNIMSATNSVESFLAIRKSSDGSMAIRLYDNTSFTTVTQSSILVGQTFRISLDYGTYTDGSQKMRLTVNGVRSSMAPFIGAWGGQDLREFFGNTMHAGFIKNLEYSDKPIW